MLNSFKMVVMGWFENVEEHFKAVYLGLFENVDRVSSEVVFKSSLKMLNGFMVVVKGRFENVESFKVVYLE